MAFYKFIEAEYLDSFFTTGCLRLGTLHNFKDTVEHGLSRGDKFEGEHQLKRINNGELKLTKDKDEPIISEMFKIGGEGEATIIGGTFIVSRKSPDGFVFCSSHYYNEELFYRWHQEEKLDSCYEIINPHGFFMAITNAIKNSAYFFENKNVIYIDDSIDYQSSDANAHPAFTKNKSLYDWQKENRTIWGAKMPCGTLNPWIIHVPEAIKYCRPFAKIENNHIIYTRCSK